MLQIVEYLVKIRSAANDNHRLDYRVLYNTRRKTELPMIL